MKTALLLLLPSLISGVAGSKKEAATSQTYEMDRYVTADRFDYTKFNTPELKLNLKGLTSPKILSTNSTESELSFSNPEHRVFFTKEGISSTFTNFQKFNMTADTYVMLLIDYSSSQGTFLSNTSYYAVQYRISDGDDETNSNNFTSANTLKEQYKYSVDGRFCAVYKVPTDLASAKFAFYINPKVGNVTFNRYMFVELGTSIPDQIVTTLNSFPKGEIRNLETRVKISNCSTANVCTDVETVTIAANNQEELTIPTISGGGYLKFEPVEGYMNLDFSNSTVKFSRTFKDIKKDIQENFNSIYHAYPDSTSELWKSNQLERLDEAIKLGIKTLEMDVDFTSDGIPVMTHDSLGKATNINVYNTETSSYLSSPIDISTISYEELLKYDFGYYYGHPNKKILTLEELLTEMRSTGIQLDLELKEASMTSEQANTINELIIEKGMENRTIISSFQRNSLTAMYKVNPELDYKLIMDTSIKLGTYLDRASALVSDNNHIYLDSPTSITSSLHSSICEQLGYKYQSYLYYKNVSDLSTQYFYGLTGATSGDGNTASYIQFFSKVVFEGFTMNEEEFEKTIDVDIDNPLTLSSVLNQVKAFDNLGDTYVDVSLVSNVKNYPQALRVGVYPIEVSALSQQGKASYATLNINVVDLAKPVISGPAEVKSGYSHPKTLNSILAEFTATDNADTSVSLEVLEDTYSSSKNTIGEYSITLKATDKSGNSVTRFVPVTVYDDSAPTITAPSKVLKNDTTILTVNDLEQYINANDEVDGDVSVVVKNDTFTGNGDKEGTYSISYAARDKYGNGSTASVDVEVNKSITGAGYLIDDSMLVTYNDKLLTEQDISSFLFASGLIDTNATETYVTVVTDTYSTSYDQLGTYSYSVKVRTTTGTEKMLSIDIRVVDAETGTLVKAAKSKWYEKAWKAIKEFFIKLWNLITKGKFEL